MPSREGSHDDAGIRSHRGRGRRRRRARRRAARRGPVAGIDPRPRRRVGDHALALPLRPRHDRCAAGGRPRARRLRGRGARLPRPAARATRRGSGARHAPSRPTGSRRSTSPRSSARPRRPGRCSRPGPASTSTRPTTCASSRSTAPRPAGTTRSAACCSRPAPTSTRRSATVHAAPRRGPARRRRARRAVPVGRGGSGDADRDRRDRRPTPPRPPATSTRPAIARGRRPADRLAARTTGAGVSARCAPRAAPSARRRRPLAGRPPGRRRPRSSPDRPSASSDRHSSASAIGPDVGAGRLEAVGRPDHRRRVAGRRRLRASPSSWAVASSR